MGFSCGRGRFLCRCCPRGRAHLPAGMAGRSMAQGLRRYGRNNCSAPARSLLPELHRRYSKSRAVHLPRGASTAALSPGHASLQKLNVALYSLSLSMGGHCFHSLCYLFPCTRTQIHALFCKSSELNSSLVLSSHKLTTMFRASPTLYFSNHSWTFLLIWHETKDLLLYQCRGNYSFPVLLNTIL